MKRAYSILTVKSVDEAARTIEGIATTPTPDRYNDVVVTSGVEFNLPLPFLNQHRSSEPIGNVIAAKATKEGLVIKAQLPAAGLLDYVDTAWTQIKAGLVRGLSIGFRSLEESFDRETGGFRFLRTEIMEISAVTVPANADCTITGIKFYDAEALAASGRERKASLSKQPGVSGKPTGKSMAKSFAAQITALENQRDGISARMGTMIEAAEDGIITDADEQREYDGLVAERDSLKNSITRLRAHEDIARDAKPVVALQGPQAPSRQQPIVQEVKRVELPKGTAFARSVIALINAKGNHMYAAELAKQYYRDTPEVALVLRAAVDAGDTTTNGWASQLIPAAQQMQNEFIELLRPATLIGRIPGLRRVPFNVAVPLQSGGGSYGWVGEAKAKPVTSMVFGSATLRWAKAAGIVVITRELARFSSPSAEAIITREMIRGCAQFLDGQFIDPDVAEVANVSPASITRDISPETPTGTTAEAFRYDIWVLLASFTSDNQDPTMAVLLMSATTAAGLAGMTNALGQPEFPNITMTGGSIMGIPVIVSETVADRVILVNASDILFADDGGVSVDVSEQASVEMSTAPLSGEESPVDGAVLKSLWQNNLVGLRVERFITWKRARVSAVAWLDNVAYAPTAPSSPA